MEGIPIPEIDPNFEPQPRARSNTWPVRPKEFDADSEGARTPNSVHSENDKQENEIKSENKDLNSVNQKKGGSRRNAWGNLSYADLITKAIQSSPEGRLTLSQIYDWMVQSVPYFRDKGDSNSSAGWKNSIRHNLSLHSRFMRVQNEGTGKSSWWVINPEAKPGKSPRRRATSMDTKEYVKKRGRVKRKVEQLRAAMEGAEMANGSAYSSAHDLSDPFVLSPQDYRQRASSNASSIGGRLSPITAYNDYIDDNLPDGLSPPVSWTTQNQLGGQDEGFSDISQGLAGIMMGDYGDTSTLQDNMITSTGMLQQQTTSPLQQQLSPNTYPDPSPTYLQVGGYGGGQDNNMRQLSPQHLSPGPCNPRTSPTAQNPAQSMNQQGHNGYHASGSNAAALGLHNMNRHPLHQRRPIMQQSLTELLEQPDICDEPMEAVPTSQLQQQQQQNNVPATNQSRPNSNPFPNVNNTSGVQSNRTPLPDGLNNLTQEQRNMITTSLLRQVLIDGSVRGGGGGGSNPPLQQQKQPMTIYSAGQNGLNAGGNNGTGGGNNMSGIGGVPLSSYMSGNMQTPHSYPPSGVSQRGPEFEFLTDINPSDFTDCPDVDQLISHELSFDNSLDFNFLEGGGGGNSQSGGGGNMTGNAQRLQQL